MIAPAGGVWVDCDCAGCDSCDGCDNRDDATVMAGPRNRERLMLPAPVEFLEIPGINAIPMTMPAQSAVPVACGARSF